MKVLSVCEEGKGKMTFNMPRKNLITILICTGGILLFFFGVLFPQRQTMAQLEHEITGLKPRIAEQKALFPFYRILKQQLDAKAAGNGNLPVKSRMSRQDIDRLPALFEKKADTCHLKLNNFNPDIDSINDNKGLMKIDLQVTGNFFYFRRFLFEISELPFLENMERLSIQSTAGSEALSLDLRICLARN